MKDLDNFAENSHINGVSIMASSIGAIFVSRIIFARIQFPYIF